MQDLYYVLVFCYAVVSAKFTHIHQAKSLKKITWCQLCRHQWHRRLSLWQHSVFITMTSTTGVSIACSAICSDADKRKHQISTSLDFVRENHRWPVDSHHKGPVTLKRFPFDDVIKLVVNRVNVHAVLVCFLMWLHSEFQVGPIDSFTHILQGFFTGNGVILKDMGNID